MHPFIQHFAKWYPASYASAHCPTVVHKRYYGHTPLCLVSIRHFGVTCVTLNHTPSDFSLSRTSGQRRRRTNVTPLFRGVTFVRLLRL
jgi:hypothetical protein